MHHLIYFLLIISCSIPNFLIAHCQIPCGIYDDALRIIQLEENFETINKAMNRIINLSENSDPNSKNQLIRWVMTKDEHASQTQEILSNYFLSQRIKSDQSSNYIDQTIFLQKLLVSAMKCKQTIDTNNVKIGQELINQFVKVYFDEHGIKHLNNLK